MLSSLEHKGLRSLGADIQWAFPFRDFQETGPGEVGRGDASIQGVG